MSELNKLPNIVDQELLDSNRRVQVVRADQIFQLEEQLCEIGKDVELVGSDKGLVAYKIVPGEK